MADAEVMALSNQICNAVAESLRYDCTQCIANNEGKPADIEACIDALTPIPQAPRTSPTLLMDCSPGGPNASLPECIAQGR